MGSNYLGGGIIGSCRSGKEAEKIAEKMRAEFPEKTFVIREYAFVECLEGSNHLLREQFRKMGAGK